VWSKCHINIRRIWLKDDRYSTYDSGKKNHNFGVYFIIYTVWEKGWVESFMNSTAIF
jgi:hypothetical protein